jgi:hypothetical protein
MSTSNAAGTYNGTNESLVELKTSMNIRGHQDEMRFEKCVHALETASAIPLT